MHFPHWHDEFEQFGRCRADLGMSFKKEIGVNPGSFLYSLWKRQNAECQRHNHSREEKCLYHTAALAFDEASNRMAG